MKNIIKQILKEELLKEGKSVGLLYHSTNQKNAIKILMDNKIISTGISTTRNKNFRYDNNPIQFVLDGDKISQNYKIRPYDYWYGQYNVPDNPQTVDEYEEIIMTESLPLKKYLISVNLYKRNEELEGLLDKMGIPYKII